MLEVSDPELMCFGCMPEQINRQRERLGYPVLDDLPHNAPAFASLILHSLAAKYAETLQRVEWHTGKRFQRLCIVGGGSRNELLNRLTADRTGLQVIRGAAESSTIGNLAVQLATLESDFPGTSILFAKEVSQWAATLHPLD